MAYRLVYHSTQGWRVTKKKKKNCTRASVGGIPGPLLSSEYGTHPRFFDEQLGSVVPAIDYVRGSGN